MSNVVTVLAEISRQNIKFHIMKLFITLSICIAFAQTTNAQNKGADSSKYATVVVNITDTKGAPRKNEQIVFYAANSKKVFGSHSNAAGKMSVKLPAGDAYMVAVKTMGDTTEFGSIDIPALAANQVYNTPFTLSIQYEPAHL
jgi:hypothetical protein